MTPETPEKNRPQKIHSGNLTLAVILIALGILFLGRNFGYISRYTFHIFFSWQMFMILLGAIFLVRKQVTSGLILMGIGGFFLLSRYTYFNLHQYWPVVLIVVGLLLLLRLRSPKDAPTRNYDTPNGPYSVGGNDGFFDSNNSFSSIQQIIVDPVFKGGKIRNTFGGTTLDLRRTRLAQPETFIEVDCSFGGVQIYVPADWNVHLEVSAVLGTAEDKRAYREYNRELGTRLIVSGNVTLGSLEIKS